MPSWAYNIIYTLEVVRPVDVRPSYGQQQSSNDGFLIYDSHTRKPPPKSQTNESRRSTIPTKNKTKKQIRISYITIPHYIIIISVHNQLRQQSSQSDMLHLKI